MRVLGIRSNCSLGEQKKKIQHRLLILSYFKQNIPRSPVENFVVNFSEMGLNGNINLRATDFVGKKKPHAIWTLSGHVLLKRVKKNRGFTPKKTAVVGLLPEILKLHTNYVLTMAFQHFNHHLTSIIFQIHHVIVYFV